ncbi:ImmA/IrrE family metallo-endopeptidase [Fodinicola acaciae]|uniref:ImmA/IrrE family metallo-endopeptidase n=1 Tax=Fodinicola acaciae TaxID=2681555 RepID=UPI001C9E28E6|nr:ImmA/IrrE family metallo-endopeptidase [Fodinicola acaciae]
MRIVAEEERAGLELCVLEPLDPYRLADEHGIPVYPLEELEDGPRAQAAIHHFTSVRSTMWSAALIPMGSSRLIIENTAHPVTRRRASLAHEMGHHLLEHEFAEMLLTEDGCRRFDQARENEAKFLSGQLLISDAAARRAAFDGKNNAQVAATYGVSEQFAQMRMSGARVMAQRALAKQARPR